MVGEQNKTNKDSSTKKCPFCAEDIKADAIKCRYCQSELSDSYKPSNTNQEEENKKLGCGTILLVIIGIVILIFIFIGIQGAIEIRDSYGSSSSSSTSVNIYRITRETGFYKFYTSEDYSETIESGTKVKPANNASSLDCRTIDVEGFNSTSCAVEVINSGKTGWVLKNAIGN